LAPIVLLKCLAVVSCKLERPRLSVMHIAPTRGLKSYSSSEVMKIFDEKLWLDLKSDFTLNSLHAYKKELAQSRSIFINDATTLFASKSQRTKDRLIGGLSELLSDESYTYQDCLNKFTLEGKVTVVMNLTSESFKTYKDRLFERLTFSERILRVHHVLSKQETADWLQRQEDTKDMCFGKIISQNDIETDVTTPKHYLPVIRHLAQEFSYASLNSQISCQDLIKATLQAHAALNKRKQVCSDDLHYVKCIQEYLTNPFSKYEGQIVRYAADGLICKKIGKDSNYRQQVERIIEKAQLRGILQSQSSQNQMTPKKRGEANG
jgi:hypothetical protein